MVVVLLPYQLQPSCLLCGNIVNAHTDFVALLASHGIFVHCDCSNALRDIHLRIAADHRLVHAVECQLLSVGTPESALENAEFIAVNASSIYDIVRTIGASVGAHLLSLPVGSHHEEVALDGVCQMLRLEIEVLMFGAFGNLLTPHHSALLPVYLYAALAVSHLGDSLFSVRQQNVVTTCCHLLAGNLVEAVNGEEMFASHQFAHLVGSGFHWDIAPPLCELILWLEVVPVGAAGHYIFQRQKPLPHYRATH